LRTQCGGLFALTVTLEAPISMAFAGSVRAQTTTSIREGRVLDQSGSALPGATIEVKGTTIRRAA
jgi:hypothetical protein